MKKNFAVLLAVLLLFTMLSGCASGTESKSGAKTFGDTESKNPLRILVDMQFGESMDDSIMNDFAKTLKMDLGMEDVVIEFLPSIQALDGGVNEDNLAVRSTAADRLRVEIMSGGGPDLFLMSYNANNYQYGADGLDVDTIDTLFKYPEKAMENGLFLPLDDYMENNTEYAEWDKFTEAVMAAGRNEEGQQIIPMAYTLPLLVIPKTDFDYTPTRELTWNDMLTDPGLLPYSLDIANCSYADESERTLYYGEYLTYVLGSLADYKEEELLFTEEELLQLIQEILALDQKDSFKEIYGARELVPSFGKICLRITQTSYNQPATMLPLYCDDGGVTAEITAYAAINRNTKKAEEAFRVLDYLMSWKMQKDSDIHDFVIRKSTSLPMHEDLLRDEESYVFSTQYYMIEENYHELCEVRDQIEYANFSGELTTLLSDILSRCASAEKNGTTVEEVVHETYVNMQRRMRE